MQLPLQITFRDIEPSPAIEARIREKAKKLDRFYDRITGCKVVVDAPHRHHEKGRIYRIRIDITVPGTEIVINREPGQNHAHEDVYVALRDAFGAAQRRLQDYARRQRGEIKTHEVPTHGHIVRIFSEQGYGFIETSDKQEIYFHENAVLNGAFPKLDIGHEVRYVAIDNESGEGAQATTVQPIGKHHVIEP